MIWQQNQFLQAGKYRIIRQIGGGGFGLTYLAEDCFFQRQVVIKAPNQIFRADQEYKKFIQRFQREGQGLAKISHLNIVQFIEFFKEGDIPCLVMAYVDGDTLNQRIRHQGRLSETEAVEHFRKLAIALQTVHKAGVIHCDIHPGNIMLQRLSNEPVLIDFGSAKFLQPTTVTITTTVNDFAPYEQRQESKRKPTLDVYGLAATLYFAVTGEKPQAAIDRKLYGDTLEPPQKHCPNLSDWLNQAILKGMALELENRPQSMQEWLGLLHQPQPTPRQAKSLQSSSQSQQKKPKKQPDHFRFPLISLGFLLLLYLLIGTLVQLGNTGILLWALCWLGAMIVAVIVAVFWVDAGDEDEAEAKAEAKAETKAGDEAGDLAVAVAMILVAGMFLAVILGVFWVVLLLLLLAVAVLFCGFVALYWAVESLKKRYDPESIFMILGITSTLGLILGGVIGWFLKLQGISLLS